MLYGLILLNFYTFYAGIVAESSVIPAATTRWNFPRRPNLLGNLQNPSAVSPYQFPLVSIFRRGQTWPDYAVSCDVTNDFGTWEQFLLSLVRAKTRSMLQRWAPDIFFIIRYRWFDNFLPVNRLR
jgi:hypothetical protein